MKIKLNGHEVEFDVFDLDKMEIYYEGTDRVQELFKQPREGMTAIQQLREVSTHVLQFFEDCLGEDTVSEIFGEKLNVKTLYEAFGAFCSTVNAELEQFGAKMKNGGLNRAQRRASK